MEYITPEEVIQIGLDRAKDELERLKKEQFKNECFDSLYGKGYIDMLDVPLNKLNYYFKTGHIYSLFIITIGIVTALCSKISDNIVGFIVVNEDGERQFTVNIEVDKIKVRGNVKFKEVFMKFMKNIQPINIELSPEEQKLQDTMDKLSDEISSQLGIPKWKADSAVKTAINTYDAYIQRNLKEEK